MANPSSSTQENKPPLKPRPLSPHLQIYRPQITSILSILHRATGVFLLLGAFLYTWELTAIAFGGKYFECYMWFATSWVGLFVAFFWLLSLFYHFFNGIRHLAWDLGFGFELENVTRSGIAVLLATAFCTLLIFSYMVTLL